MRLRRGGAGAAPAGGPAPIAVLTGFLGAGKTTLLNRALADPRFARTAVVVNEFGAVGVDHHLVEAVSGDMLLLTTGCLCCAARGDLLAAVEELLAQRPALGFDRIAVETTGLADPGPVLNALLLGPALGGAARLGGVLTLVSAADGGAALDRHGEARRQAALADRILVTKGDLAERAVPDLVARLRALNPTAEVGDARSAAPEEALFGPAPPRAPRAEAVALDHHAADAAIRAAVLEAGTVDADRLAAFVAALQARLGDRLLRLKGLAALRHDPGRPAVVQAVGHLLHPAPRLAAWPPGRPGTRLVAILDGADPAEAEALWRAFFGAPAADQPDALALAREGGPSLFG